VQLWLPEAHGPVDAAEPAHRVLLMLLGAQSKRYMARLSFWAVNRDFGGAIGAASGTCNGISRSNYASSNVFRQFMG